MSGTAAVDLPNATAITFFFLFIAITLAITWWAARRTKTTEEYFAAGRRLTAWQNGLALAGDFTAAAGFLGITGLISLVGFDGLVYVLAALAGWPLLLFLFAEPLRKLGKYTVADALAHCLNSTTVRAIVGLCSLVYILLFLIVQLVGAGNVIRLMFGLSYRDAVIVIGAIMMCYALFGGMLGATWVQIIKAVLMLIAAAVTIILSLSYFDFSFVTLFEQVSAKAGAAMLAPGKGFPTSWEVVSTALAALCGLANQPHVLMRVFTVPDARTARRSVFYATTLIAIFSVMTAVLGFAAAVIIGQGAIRAADPGGNMAFPLLSAAVGGTAFLGFVAAVSFATILAAVVGLVINGSATLAHDFWGGLIRRKQVVSAREQLILARVATVLLCVVATILGIAFQGQNVAFLGVLTLAVAGSTNFPTLFLAIFWRRLTVPGAVVGMLTGLIASLTLLYLSPLVQVDLLHNAHGMINLRNPGLISIPLAFFANIAVSLVTRKESGRPFAYAEATQASTRQ